MELLVIVLFLAALIGIVFDWIDRTKIALLGAAAVVLVGAIGEEEAIAAIDWGTLGLLAGMMIVVGLTQPTGIFGWIGLHAIRLSRGKPALILVIIALLTGVLSAFLDNLTAILLVLPIAFTVSRILGINPIPLIITQILASNIGGTATLIGDPPNIMIAGYVRELSFMDFIVNLAPPSIAALVVAIGFLLVAFRRSLRVDPALAHPEQIAQLDPSSELRGTRRQRVLVLTVLGGTIVAFFLHSLLHLEPPVVALVGATLMLLVTDIDIEHALERVEWATLFFFIGLFVMVGALEEQGVIEGIASAMASITGDSEARTAMVIMWGAALGSAVVDNIPFTAAMMPVVDILEGPELNPTLWWALALGACFGGNATIVAAAANVAASGIAKREGHHISFLRFLAVGLPVAVLSLIVASAWILLVHV